MILPVVNIPLSSRHRVSQIKFHPTQSCIAIQSHDRSVEIFRIRTEEEVRKKQARRKKRAKEKKGKEQVAANGKNISEDEMEVDSDTEINVVDIFTPHLVVRASGRIRSFDFGSEVNQNKGIQVSHVALYRSLLMNWLISFLLHWPKMPWKSTTSL
jgi:U3 small nucleolar RNA-associated protein 12